ncbi:MAG: 6-phosphofructokinase [Candidatus Izimaplasma sp.]|nr:6-phosphofructokinase [Candidatus Izimaplasma bacterium]
MNILYGQSGGPSSVINASAYGLINAALNREEINHIYVMKHGIKGALENNLYHIDEFKESLGLLENTPGSAFGSVRFKLSDYKTDETPYKKLLDVLKQYNIDYIFYNGGNDSMDTCLKIGTYFNDKNIPIKVMGIPKTIDNDLPETDHTPGFGSAAKFIINTVMQVAIDATIYPQGKVTIIEVMGRNAGWLTAASYFAKKQGFGPDLVYLPEVPVDINKLLDSVKDIYQTKQNCLIVVSEGIKDARGDLITNTTKNTDQFGHTQLGGVSYHLSHLIKKTLGLPTRAIELNTPQRSASYIRSKTDVKEAKMVGQKALDFALKGETNKMVTIKRLSNTPYQVAYETSHLKHIANKEAKIPKSMIDFKNNTMKQAFFDYLTPLISGEQKQQYKNGVQTFFKL